MTRDDVNVLGKMGFEGLDFWVLARCLTADDGTLFRGCNLVIVVRRSRRRGRVVRFGRARKARGGAGGQVLQGPYCAATAAIEAASTL